MKFAKRVIIERNAATFAITSIVVVEKIILRKKNDDSVSIERSAEIIWLSVSEDINCEIAMYAAPARMTAR